MKKIPIFIISLLSAMLHSCVLSDFDPQEWGIEPELSFSQSGIIFNSTVNTDTIQINTNYSDFLASSSQDWCTVSIDKDKSIVSIQVSPNYNTKQRIATVSVSVARGTKYLSKDISVVQMGGIWETIGSFNLYWGYEVGQSQKEIITNLLENMVYVEGGSYIMGLGAEDIVDGAIPHQVSLSGFYISKTELTQQQWSAIMGTNPSKYKGANKPVENISWEEAFEYVTRLSKLLNISVSLPTEAQWEYAARGGKYSMGYKYPGSNNYDEVAHHEEDNLSFNFETIYVGTLLPNELGLHDMAGNVAEYCNDWYIEKVNDTQHNPVGPSTGSWKVVRGGSFGDSYYHFKSINRNPLTLAWPNKVCNHTGFRIVITQ